jgi:hypothetical protein
MFSAQKAEKHIDTSSKDQMSDLLPLFAEEPDALPSTPEPELATTITDSQRLAIRRLFLKLGISDAATQFDLVEELTNRRIRSVASMEFAHAQTLIRGLEAHMQHRGKTYTGNAWDDRDEDTWIDKL